MASLKQKILSDLCKMRNDAQKELDKFIKYWGNDHNQNALLRGRLEDNVKDFDKMIKTAEGLPDE